MKLVEYVSNMYQNVVPVDIHPESAIHQLPPLVQRSSAAASCLAKVLEEVRRAEFVAFDLELTGLHVTGRMM